MRRIYTFICLIFVALNAQAQSLEIYRLSNSSGAYAVGFNPALLADSRVGGMLNLGQFHAGLSSNDIKNRFVPSSGINVKLKDQTFNTQDINLQGPSFMKQFKRNAAFAISTHYRSFQLPEGELSYLFSNNLESNTNKSLSGSYKSAGLKELAFSYAHPLAFKQHFVKVGGTVKLVSLYHYYQFQSSDLSLSNSRLSGSLSFQANPGNDEFDWLDLLKSKSNGTGFDFGFVYEFRPKYTDYEYKMDGKSQYDPAKNKYLARLAFSITDMGGFKTEGLVKNGLYSNTTIDPNKLSDGLPAAIGSLSLVGETINQLEYRFAYKNQAVAEVQLQRGWHLGTAYRSDTKNSSGL
ncbi:MAG: conjugal transfer protein TraF [Cytophagaceae bacterium]|nr:conjugal transfer protein TraF [Cytophagaceae bacterium]